MRIPLKSGNEYDALTKAKNYCFWKPGQRKRIKRGYNKRVRKQTKLVLCTDPLNQEARKSRDRPTELREWM